MKSKMHEILQLPTEQLEKLSDAELAKLLGALVPQSRVSNKNHGADDVSRAIKMLENLMKTEQKK